MSIPPPNTPELNAISHDNKTILNIQELTLDESIHDNIQKTIDRLIQTVVSNKNNDSFGGLLFGT